MAWQNQFESAAGTPNSTQLKSQYFEEANSGGLDRSTFNQNSFGAIESGHAGQQDYYCHEEHFPYKKRRLSSQNQPVEIAANEQALRQRDYCDDLETFEVRQEEPESGVSSRYSSQDMASYEEAQGEPRPLVGTRIEFDQYSFGKSSE